MATAFPAAAATFDIEASSDLRRRGIGWSDGRAALEAYASVPIAGPLSAEIGAATLRGSRRHGGADAAADAALRLTTRSGPWQLWTDVVGHGFAGGSGPLDYAELRAGASFGLGPAQLGMQAAWAPAQGAIGGSNVYLGARAAVGIPGTPWTVAAGAGRSMGTSDGTGRSNRLRPGGDYTDVRLDVDHVRGPLTLGVSATATSIDRDRIADPAAAEDVRPRLLVRAALRF
ncbi:TorF family putative porin [Sandarakinorhabdus sp. DWP1-3-1]|uniref:TorF family putative porin n=1 Tax=Sandarakinorhabdus sp. DWP1-3-1 TaxID=2804627 RepID=UPI003CEF943B